MGYSTTFRLKKELDSDFVPWVKKIDESELNKYKSILRAICELPYKDELKDRYSTSLFALYNKIYYIVNAYVTLISSAWKIDLKSRFYDDNKINFWGWEYSKDDAIWKDENDVAEFFTNDLFCTVVKPTSGPFDQDNDDYNQKAQEIWDQINEIEDSVWTALNHKFIRRYRNSEDADESDGYNHKFPEEDENVDVSKQEISNQNN